MVIKMLNLIRVFKLHFKNINRLGAFDFEQSIPDHWSGASVGPITECCFGYETGITKTYINV